MSSRSRAFLLGAGFSKAISARMPVTDELGNAILDRLGKAEGFDLSRRFANGSFETWLSNLAQEQPFLTSAQNLMNRALFQRMAQGVADVLGERVQEALAEPRPDWLVSFIRLCHLDRTDLVTFNYDPLLECAVSGGLINDLGQSEPVAWNEITQDVPAWVGSGYFASTPANTFRLLKMHGSLNWYWSQDDFTGVSIARRALPGGFGSPSPYDEFDRRRKLPGRAPFVVPPSSSKSDYFRIPLLRDIWRQAFEALRDADSVILAGYSVPLTDQTTAEMIRAALADSDSTITILDVSPQQVIIRLKDLGIDEARLVAPLGGSTLPIADFVSDWARQRSEDTVADLRLFDSGDLDRAILVYWAHGSTGVVVDIQARSNGTHLSIEDPANIEVATRSRRDENQDTLPTLQQLLDAHRGGPLIVEMPEGGTQMVISHGDHSQGFGYGDGKWHVMLTDGVR